MVRAVKDKKENYCFACFDDNYPILWFFSSFLI
jgi:amidophosphoribosyltransferase